MAAGLQRMRRELAGDIPEPHWPDGYRAATFTPADAPEVHRLLELGYADGGGEVGPIGVWWPGLRDDSEYAQELCFLAMDENGAIVGVAQCWTTAFVKDLVVHPAARRRGVAEALLVTVFAAFQRCGATHVDLKVRIDNPSGAARLYRRLGMVDAPMEG